jgi:hypothetical protein
MNARSIALRGTVCAIAVVVGLVATSMPASATVHSFNVEMTRGRISVGTTNFDTPTTPAPDCPGTTGITGTVDDATGGAISGTLNIATGNFALPFFGGRYRMTATGASATGTYTGGATGTFSGMTFATISFQIRTISSAATGCVVGTTVVCGGTASLTTVTGGINTGSTLTGGLSTGEQVFVNGSGTITSVTPGTCNFPWSAVVTNGAALTLTKNPVPGTDLGAIFTQL